MAAPHIGVIAAIVRKDFNSLWPLIIGAAVLPIWIVGDRLIDLPEPLPLLLFAIGAFAIIALAVTLFHQDAAPSVRHDWLTRPIGPVNLIAAKVAFLFLFLGAPVFVAQFARELLQDHSLAEALLSSLVVLTTGALAMIPVIFLALVTSSLVEALGVMFAFAIVSVLALIFLQRNGGNGGGAAWILQDLDLAVALIFAVFITFLLFRRKAPMQARLAYFVGLTICTVGVAFMPGRAAIAVGLQQRMGADAPEAKSLSAKIEVICRREGGGAQNFRKNPASYLHGDLAIAGQPAGWQVAIDHIQAQYLGRGDKAGERVWAGAREAGAPSAEGNTWTLETPGPVDPANSQNLVWTYALTLLEPVGSQDLIADGKRRYLPGFGYCNTEWDGRGEVNVKCFKPFSQPAAISTQVVGKPQTFNLTSTPISYRPAILEGLGDYRQGSPRRQAIGKQLSPPQVLRLTAYAPRAHVSRQMSMPLPSALPTCGRGT